MTATNFSVHDPVISDHLALHCNLHVDKPPNIKKRINYRKFRSINTDDFQHDIVNSALYSSPKTVLAELSDQYDSVLSYYYYIRLNDANLNGAGAILVS